MKTKLLITILAFTSLTSALTAQVRPAIDSLPPVLLDSLPISEKMDSLDLSTNKIVQNPATDFSTFSSPSPSSNVAYSKDSLDQEVESFGRDSMYYDIANKEVHLWGAAYVTYGDIKLEADYIVYNWTDNIVTAEYSKDSLGNKIGRPEFSDASQKFTANKMRFNFKTKKGIVLEAVSAYSGLIVHGEKVKVFDKNSDSLHREQHIYSKDALFTTCDHPEPHFGIRSRKQVLIPDKVVVVGPSNIELGGVPTPLWLPFAFFPLNTGESTGFLFPQNYGYSEARGYGLEGIGWYFPINDYMNLQIRGDIHTRGNWGLSGITAYRKLYKYSGSANISFSSFKLEDAKANTFRNNSMALNLTHNQDAKAHPTRTFGGSVRIQTNNYQNQNFDDAESVFTNTLSSNLNFTQRFPDKPYTLTASLNHSQNTATNVVDISLPNVKFTMRRIEPFKSKDPTAEDKWYDKIGVNYTGEAKNRFLTTDTTLFTQQTLDDARYGAKHTVRTDASFQFLKYFTFTPAATYTEVWNFRTLDKVFDPTLEIDTILVDSVEMFFEYDTLSYGSVMDNTVNGFKALRQFNTSASISTKIFGTLLFKKGPLRGLRHTMSPTVGLSYTPDYTRPGWGYFDKVQTSLLDQEEDFLEYTIFEGGAFTDIPSRAGKQMNITYGLGNIFEGKYYSKKDSTERKFRIFDSVRLNGSYNLARDSFQWSVISMNGRMSLIPQISTLAMDAVFDPYIEKNNRPVNKLVWEDRKRPARFDRASATINTSFTIKKLVEILSRKNKTSSGERPRNDNQKKTLASADLSLLDLIDNFSIRHNFKVTLENRSFGDIQKDTFFISTNSIVLQGNLQLTEKWRLTLSQISYNFKEKNLVYPQLGLTRDLHCWTMNVGWTPGRNSFTFTLGVKPGSALDFIKVPYGRNRFDGQQVGGGRF